MRMRDHEQARRISEFVDSLVVRRRVSRDASMSECGHESGEFRDLSRLAAILGAVRVVLPAETDDELLRRLVHQAAQPTPSRAGLSGRLRSVVAHWREWGGAPFLKLKSATIAGVAAVVVLVVLNGGPLPSASAAEILTRADAALDSLVPPGKLLFRRWRIVDRIRDRQGAPERVDERYTLEWIDGSNRRRAIGQSFLADGHMYALYVHDVDHGEYVQRIYYAPGRSALGLTNESGGLVSIVPSAAEFAAAVARFPEPERRVLNAYLARGYIYQPLLSERRFNDAMLKEVAGRAPLPRVRLSLDDSEIFSNRPVHKVRSIDAIRVQFRWTSAGPPRVWLERQETVRYISRATYLTVKSEETNQSETGRLIRTTRELVETRVMDEPLDGSSPFNVRIPEPVTVRRQSAYEQLSQVIQALARASEFLSRQ